MKILALEFSTERRSVAVVEASTDRPPTVPGEAHAESREVGALTLVEQALQVARCEREDVGVIAVGLGPGSYTGIRVAIAIAQGWQLVRPVKLIGVSSVECLAAQARQERFFGGVSLVVDAQRNEFYLARYRIEERVAELVEPLRLASFAAVQMAANAGDVLVGPEIIRWFPNSRLLIPDAAMLGRIAAGREDFTVGEKLEPVYLRDANFVKAPTPRLVP
ncbi:MAG: tRNA (adenosine(37)-N6)-threonylcarbamoyltransferase complex dimerization subunit type 1 TsaB [Verrucomicrobia bacterium]|nr:tRNA (adenosine(37)-N6)-threonylcarbamoyltransferase complex dimerization subunit type 1 TsaB [Verrucomicrobiota bacterium]